MWAAPVGAWLSALTPQSSLDSGIHKPGIDRGPQVQGWATALVSADPRQLSTQTCHVLGTAPEVRPLGPAERVAGPPRCPKGSGHPSVLRVPGQNLGKPCFMKPGVSFLMGKLLWNKRVCVCVCARMCVGVRMQGKREKRREEGKNKQPNSKDMWFSSCGLMQGLRGLSEDQSPECGSAKDWVGLGSVLRTKSLLRKLCPGRGGQRRAGVSSSPGSPPGQASGLPKKPSQPDSFGNLSASETATQM